MIRVLWQALPIDSLNLVRADLEVTHMKFNGLLRIAFGKKKFTSQTGLMNEA